DTHEGRGTFVPREVRAREPLPPLDHPAVLARACDVVRSATHEELVRALLGDVVFVATLEDAVELSARGTGHTFATLEGEVVFPWGGIVGGDRDGAGAGLLQQRREVEQLREVTRDRKSTRLNSSHVKISYAVFCLKKKHKAAMFLI